LEIIAAALSEAGARMDDVVRTRIYLTAVEYSESVGRAHGAAFSQARPASTQVVVAGLLDPRWKVEIEAEAIVD
jgi:enamine deaminase RidA (YjgF/YER057c/UK114 family)